LYLCFGIAKELGMSLGTLLTTMTGEEIQGWSVYFEIHNERMKKATGG
jgi:hypothetical protein